MVRKTEKLKGEIGAPSSKSYTQRMVIAASLSPGTSRISDPLLSDDTQATLSAVKALGTKVTETESSWIVMGPASLKGARKPIDCGNSGATLRFMVPIAALATKPSVFLLGSSLEKRPIEQLLQSLRQLGVETSTRKLRGKSLIKVEGGGIRGGSTSIRGDVSSQFISGLMFACPKAQNDSEINLTTPLESRGYVEMTREVLLRHGVRITFSRDLRQLHVPSDQLYEPCNHRVPGDFSSAAFVFGAAAITNSEITVKNLDFSFFQGDIAIVTILKQMGAQEKVYKDQIEIDGTGELLKAFDVNSKDTPDLVPVFSALACYADGISRICGAGRLKLKESNRLEALQLELGKMGADITIDEDTVTVKGPCELHGAEINPHNDHRIAMACAVAAIGAKGETVIHDAECVKKSYPRFFNDLYNLGVDVVGGKFDW